MIFAQINKQSHLNSILGPNHWFIQESCNYQSRKKINFCLWNEVSKPDKKNKLLLLCNSLPHTFFFLLAIVYNKKIWDLLIICLPFLIHLDTNVNHVFWLLNSAFFFIFLSISLLQLTTSRTGAIHMLSCRRPQTEQKRITLI